MGDLRSSADAIMRWRRPSRKARGRHDQGAGATVKPEERSCDVRSGLSRAPCDPGHRAHSLWGQPPAAARAVARREHEGIQEGHRRRQVTKPKDDLKALSTELRP